MAITTKIDRNLLLDILSTAVEYSCVHGYWGQVEEYKWYWWYVLDEKKEPTDVINPELTPDTVLLKIRDSDEEGTAEKAWKKWHPITLKNLEEATQWALENYNHLFSRFSVSKGIIDDIDYDASGADVILQKIVLGDVVYG